MTRKRRPVFYFFDGCIDRAASLVTKSKDPGQSPPHQRPKELLSSRRYTRWLEAVIVKGTENQEIYVTFSPHSSAWLESKKRLPKYVFRKPANLGLRSRYLIRFYDWAKKHVEAGTKTAPREELRRVLGLESVKDADGNVIHEAPKPVSASFRQRALDVAILEINTKTRRGVEPAWRMHLKIGHGHEPL